MTPTITMTLMRKRKLEMTPWKPKTTMSRSLLIPCHIVTPHPPTFYTHPSLSHPPTFYTHLSLLTPHTVTGKMTSTVMMMTSAGRFGGQRQSVWRLCWAPDLKCWLSFIGKCLQCSFQDLKVSNCDLFLSLFVFLPF